MNIVSTKENPLWNIKILLIESLMMDLANYTKIAITTKSNKEIKKRTIKS